MLPSMRITLSVGGPLMVTGALPSSEPQVTPHVARASSNGPMGLLLMDSSPVMVVSESNSAAMPVMSLMVVPEFLTSMILSGAWRPSDSTRRP